MCPTRRALDEADGAQPGPRAVVVEVGDEGGVADRPVAMLLQPPMILLDRRPVVVIGRGILGERAGAGGGEGVRDLLVQRRMVVLEGKYVVGLLGDELRGDGGLAARCVDADRRSIEVE